MALKLMLIIPYPPEN